MAAETQQYGDRRLGVGGEGGGEGGEQGGGQGETRSAFEKNMVSVPQAPS